ncbi:hypothetical protein K502DRAFT_210652 [Neoconidiobolus thromboides FSU 785]|nr:hypothetical protein K502DRAFT_210652 [Neoconidiobolus thromboides FSU 785]
MTDNPTSLNNQEANRSNGKSTKNHDINSDSDERGSKNGLTIRALVSSKEAGVIIGKGGKNVTDIRDATGARAGVSKVIQGVPTRVLSISGTLDSISQAYGRVAKALIESVDSSPEASTNLKAGTNTTSVRILISHSIMGSVIGKQGTKIKAMQEVSGTRMIATKEMLGQSTERVVEIHGNPDSIVTAMFEIGKCILADFDKTQNTVLYNPSQRLTQPVQPTGFYPNFQSTFQPPINGGEYNYLHGAPRFLSNPRFENHIPHPHVQPHINPAIQALPHHSSLAPMGLGPAIPTIPTIPSSPLVTKKLSIASDMVGCVIGKHGSKIAEIRRLSSAKISIAKEAESDTNTRLFTIYGTAEANETAIYLIYAQLEAEKERRASHPLADGKNGNLAK